MITQIPNWQTLTPEEIRSYLLATEWVPNPQAVTVAHITAAVGLETGALVVGTVDAAGASNPLLRSSFVALSTTGMQLHTPERQGMIDMLAAAGSWPDVVRDAIKALGGSMVPRWQTLGYQSEPTIESIHAELDGLEKLAIVNAARSSVNAKATAINAWLDILEIDGMTVENVTEYVAMLLDSEDGNPP